MTDEEPEGTRQSPLATEDYWVACSKCNTAYIVRRRMDWSGNWKWLWCADCRCKKADPAIVYKEDQ